MLTNISSLNIPQNSDLRSPLTASLSGMKKFVRFRRGAWVGLLRWQILLTLDSIMLFFASWGPYSQELSLIQFLQQVNTTSWFVPMAIIMIGIMISSGLYEAGKRWQNLWDVMKATTWSTILVGLVVIFCSPEQVQVWMTVSQFLSLWVSSALLVCMGRLCLFLLTKLARSKGIICHTVFLICDDQNRKQLLERVEGEEYYTVIGSADTSCLDLDNRDTTFQKLQEMKVEEVIVPWDVISRRTFLSWHFQKAGITLQVLPCHLEPMLKQPCEWTMTGVPVQRYMLSTITGLDFWVKRCVDFCMSSLAIVLLSPIYLTIACLIKWDSPGPIFYKQARVGLHGKQFEMWKFRTMVANADQLQAQLESQNEGSDGILFKMKDDPRITKVGKFLRRYSLDELPQIFNVLLGEMSFVGPRPLPLRDVERFSSPHFIRHEVLPGITGLWQVSGRSDVIDFEKVFQLDLTYIENWSLYVDFKILLKTLVVVFQTKGAY